VALDREMPAGVDLTLGTALCKPVKIALSNTFGFGGHCASVVFGRLP
jgi:3-oxoacyl-[acyl-carrier-protein] synthase II